jgi:hypothetical protein
MTAPPANGINPATTAGPPGTATRPTAPPPNPKQQAVTFALEPAAPT